MQSEAKELKEVFHECDLDGSGYIDKTELAKICNLSFEELSDIFNQLDKDGDGRISAEEFFKGYHNLSTAQDSRKREKMRERLRSEMSEEDKLMDKPEPQTEEYVGGLQEGLRALSCQEQVCELYQNLHTAENPELVQQFENILVTVLNDVRGYQLENERLEKTYRKEKDDHDKHLRRLEEEMENQVHSVEERVRTKAKEQLESEKHELRNQLDSEIVVLQQSLRKLQQDGESKRTKDQESHILNMKKRLEDIQSENRVLKSDLTDAHTNLAYIKSQMSSVQQQLDEKNFELEVENRTFDDYLDEQENLRRQLSMLHEANKSLLDTNDNLREMLDSPATTIYKNVSTDSQSNASGRSGSVSPGQRSRKGSVMSDYINNSPAAPTVNMQAASGMIPRYLAMNHIDNCEVDNLPEDLGDQQAFTSIDSGHSTLRDLNDINDDTEIDSISVQSDRVRRSRRHKKDRDRVRPSVRVEEENEATKRNLKKRQDMMRQWKSTQERIPNRMKLSRLRHISPDSHDEMDTDTDQMKYRSIDVSSLASRASGKSGQSFNCEESVFSQSSRSSRGSSRRQLPLVPTRSIDVAPVAKEPERMYKIVLAGDAAVGKSSFIVRLCKGKFVANLSSTLGVDFQTKVLDVDGQATALQLWDTAGQERFRSVAKTYFRRADGVLLLYDVTYERSFLNVREWVDSIEQCGYTKTVEGSIKKIPFMLVANKTDIREATRKQNKRVVEYEDGQRLSKELDALFIESSAKDGSNITEAVIELTRILRTNEDMEVKSVGMQLKELNEKKNNKCCS